jgi:hypothetical protein
LHEACPRLLQGPEARSALALEDSEATLEGLPEALQRVYLGAVRRHPPQDDVVRYLDALRPRRPGLRPPADLATLGLRRTTLLEKEADAVGIQARPFPPEGVPRGGLHGSLQPVGRLEGLHALEGLASIACETPMERPGEPEPACVVAAAPHGWRRGLPASGGDRPEAARALGDQGRRGGNVCVAWRGRGRVSWALRG